ncbi:MAG: hypothetical protein U0T73_07180 [Chitinophagales bacterium]
MYVFFCVERRTWLIERCNTFIINPIQADLKWLVTQQWPMFTALFVPLFSNRFMADAGLYGVSLQAEL